MVLNDRVRQKLEGKEDIAGKRIITENVITTLAFLNFLKFFGLALMLLAIFFFFETTFQTNLVSMVFTVMGFFFLVSGIAWDDRVKRKIRRDVY